MFSAIRKHLNPSTLIALLALIFAATGGAFAATSGNSGGGGSHTTLTATAAKTKAKAKTKTGPRGPAGPAGKNGGPGPAGATGATGPQGPAGAGGPQGPTGPTGAAGAPGEKGAAGKDGKAGVPGATGSPWTAGGTLPKGSTETGGFSFGPTPPESITALPLVASFAIPLAAALTNTEGCKEVEASRTLPCSVHFINTAGKEIIPPETVASGGKPQTICAGSATEPTATAGNLCVYETSLENIETLTVAPVAADGGVVPAASRVGAVLRIEQEALHVPMKGQGTWAVTAP